MWAERPGVIPFKFAGRHSNKDAIGLKATKKPNGESAAVREIKLHIADSFIGDEPFKGKLSITISLRAKECPERKDKARSETRK